MPRRNYRQAKNGQVYASEWPEWHVDCAQEGCEEHALVAQIGEAFTIKEAEEIGEELKDWRKVKGLWYCPKHCERKA